MDLAVQFDRNLKTDGIFERPYQKPIKDQPCTEEFIGSAASARH